MGMSRKLRFVPHARTLISITCRTVQGRFLFRPGPQFNDLVLGVLGRAQRRYETTISAVFVMSSHVLCGAAHKKCYGECPVMWSWRARLNQVVGMGDGDCA
jgi:hypothetical protein